jgi:carboxylesterase type B
VASGVPALFKKDSSKDTVIDIEGEKDDLLEKKEETKDDKADELKMEDIKLDDDEKKDEIDKSQGSEKKDPEKGGEVMEEKSKMDRLKRLPSDAVRQVSSLERQKICGIVGILVGLLLLILVIVIAAAPRGWKNYHKLVEDGKYVETETSCGKVWGWVEGDDRFLFRSIPYSVDVERFSHSRLPATLDECGDEIRHPNNESRVCMRRTLNGVVGEEDCLTLDIATSSVVYDNPAPVVVYIGGDNDKLVPSAELANKKGVVFVTVSVRQGILGYLSHKLLSESEKPPTSGNYAVGDLITALKWVQLNIRHFGGNPDMVTLLGHQQGASLATVLTAVEGGHGLYKRVWATGGAGFIEMLSLEDSSSQFNGVVNSVCKDNDRDCLLEVEAEDLVGKVDEDAETWSHNNLPSRGEKSMLSWITMDTQLIKTSFASFWGSSPVSVPVVFGAAAQSEANSVNYQLYDWNNTDQVESIVESSLGSFDVSLSTGALELYNSSNMWLDYISMVSDIRTVCPLRQFAKNFRESFSASKVSFYVTQEANPLEEDESGNVADSSTDISAIFGLYEDASFGLKLQSKFFQFVTGNIDKLGDDVMVFDEEDVKDSDAKCSFWIKTSDEIVPKFAKRF